VLQQIIEDAWDDWSSCDTGISLEERILLPDDYWKYLGAMEMCGNPETGFALYTCETCGIIQPQPFTCKERLCPRCKRREAIDRTDYYVNEVFYPWMHRLFTLTLPPDLRWRLEYQWDALSHLFTKAAHTIYNGYLAWSRDRRFLPGFVMVMETAGVALNWNPHFHAFVTRSVANPDTREVKPRATGFPFRYIRKVWQLACLDTLEGFALIDAPIRRMFEREYPKGFNVHGDKPAASQRPEVQRSVLGYMFKPIINRMRLLRYDRSNRIVTFRYPYYDYEKGKQTLKEERYTPCRFLAQLLKHRAPKDFKTCRAYGLYSVRVRKRSRLHGYCPNPRSDGDCRQDYQKRKVSWRKRMQVTIHLDPLLCPRCGGMMSLETVIVHGAKQRWERLLSEKILIGGRFYTWHVELMRPPPAPQKDSP
jgi:hypothetical protein